MIATGCLNVFHDVLKTVTKWVRLWQNKDPKCSPYPAQQPAISSVSFSVKVVWGFCFFELWCQGKSLQFLSGILQPAFSVPDLAVPTTFANLCLYLYSARCLWWAVIPKWVQTSSDECHVFPGSGCHAMDDIIAQAINSSVSVADYQGVVKSYTTLPFDQEAVGKLKQCFLDQSEETLANVTVMMVIIHFLFFLLYYYIYLYGVHIYTYIIYTYMYMLMYFIHLYLHMFIHTHLFIHMYIFPLMRKNNFQCCDW